MLWDDSSSPDEDDRARPLFRDRTNLEFRTEYEFNERFRMNTEKMEELRVLLGPYLDRPTNRSRALEVKLQLCVALHWMGTGGQYHTIVDMHSVSKATVCNTVHEVVRAANDNLFQEKDNLKKMRVLDDKIVYALNTSIPTESFQSKMNPAAACQDLYSLIEKGHTERESVIKNCIVVTAETVKNLKAAKDQSPDNYEVQKNLKNEQKKLRLLQTELSVEEVIKEKTSKLFTEKCRTYFKPNLL